MASDGSIPATPYALIGGEPAVRRLVHRFYELMDTLPEAWTIRQLHPESLSGSEEKLFEYLSGWLGGPPLFESRHGHPRLRARHLAFPIASRERDEWMLCMRQACTEVIQDVALRDRILQALDGLADHMRNRREHPAG
ncbi:MAG: group II truncated hemoglobin [Zoogloeaceae bacterium]|nr:group II truncated hemoglobin [Zoogloeaceae bacterium]